MNLQEHLTTLKACRAAREWARGKIARQAWEECEIPGWMVWWVERTSRNNKQQIVKTACKIARLVLHLILPGELRPLRAIEAAEKWVAEPTRVNLDAAHAASYNAFLASSYYPVISVASTYATYAAALTYYTTHSNDIANIIERAFAADANAGGIHEVIRGKICSIIRENLILPWDDGETMRYMLSYYVNSDGQSANRCFDSESELVQFAIDNKIAYGSIFQYVPSPSGISTLEFVRHYHENNEENKTETSPSLS